MFFPELFGSVEIEERRPRSWNEPRRKRLNFVRSHDRKASSSSDEWALAPLQGNARRYRNDAETWDLRRYEAQDRFHQRQLQHRDQDHHQRIQHIHQLYGPPPMRQLQPPPPHPGQHRIREIEPRGHHHEGHDDDIVEVVSGSESDDDDDDHGFDDRGRGPRRVPLSIERDHDKDHGRVPAIVQLTGGGSRRSKGGSKPRRRSRSRGAKKGKQHDSDSEAEDREFVRGFAAGVRTASRPLAHGGAGGGSDRGSPRKGRRFERDDESDDSMEFRRVPLRRSRSRGRQVWGV